MANASLAFILVPLRLFLRDFASFAGAKGLKALLFIILSAVVESVGLVLLIPFISVIVESQNAGGWVQSTAERLFGLFSADTRLARLSLLVTFFVALMIVRAIIVTVRDVTMVQLGIGFTQQLQSRITRRLVSARWDTVSRLRHSRITHLMGAVQQVTSASFILLHDAATVVMLASQIVLAFLLAPLLAALALGVVLLGVVTLLPMLRRARGAGIFITNASLMLIDNMTQFLGALKLAISQNLQEGFTREFEATLAELKAQQIRYVRQQTMTRLALTTLASLFGLVAILLGIAVTDVAPSILITLLLIFSRMSGPAIQLQFDAQQFAHIMPTYERFRELENDLAAVEVAASSIPPRSSPTARSFSKMSRLCTIQRMHPRHPAAPVISI